MNDFEVVSRTNDVVRPLYESLSRIVNSGIRSMHSVFDTQNSSEQCEGVVRSARHGEFRGRFQECLDFLDWLENVNALSGVKVALLRVSPSQRTPDSGRD